METLRVFHFMSLCELFDFRSAINSRSVYKVKFQSHDTLLDSERQNQWSVKKVQKTFGSLENQTFYVVYDLSCSITFPWLCLYLALERKKKKKDKRGF